MNEYLDPSTEGYSNEEFDIERALRPISFDDFTGQEQVLENLKLPASLFSVTLAESFQ